MIKKISALILACLLLGVSGISPAYAATSEEKEARFVQKVKAGINRLGTGEAARVELKLLDKTKLKGYISEANEDYFVVVDASGQPNRVAYPQVKSVKGKNLSNGVKNGILLGILAAPFIITVIFLKLSASGS